MKPLHLLLTTLALLPLTTHAQKGKGKGGLRKQSESQGNYRVGGRGNPGGRGVGLREAQAQGPCFTAPSKPLKRNCLSS